MSDLMNKRLHCALVDRFGDVGVQNRGYEGRYSCPPTKNNYLKKIRKETKFAQVNEWGETCSVNCPLCGDSRKRLYISHFTGRDVKVSNSKYQFGKVAVCHNEKCDLRELLNEILDEAEKLTDIQMDELSAQSRVKYMNFVRGY